MHFAALYLAATVVLTRAQSASQYGWSILDYDNNQWSLELERDVCVIGGGASGIHAAVRLVDMNQTVAVVEQRDYLGGHTYTYVDPNIDLSFDIGVIVYQPWSIVRHYFSRFNIPLVNQTTLDPNKTPYPCWMYPDLRSYYVDFRYGTEQSYNPFPPGFEHELEDVIGVLQQYPSVLTSYNLPSPTPEDLYMPFGTFVDKYNLTALVRFNHFYSQGQADMLNLPTLYIIKYFNLQDYLNIATQSGWLSTARYRNSELYEAAASYIGRENVFLQSTVMSTSRNSSGPFKILISTASSNLTLLSCNKILSTIPPSLSNLANWDLTDNEYALFSRYRTSNGYWTALARNISIPDDLCFTNVADRP